MSAPPSDTPPPGTRAPAPPPETRSALRLSPFAWLSSALGMIACVGVADNLAGSEVSLILFYLAPIGFGTWFVNLRGGIFLTVAAACVSVAADALHRAESGRVELPVAVLAWNGLVQAGTSLALVLVLVALRSKLQNEELLARTDALTQIANRRAFFETAGVEIERARRNGRPLALAYIDCDDFKEVNDRLGHAQGDALLVTAAQTLRAATRAADSVARLGGDEFGLLLPETDAAEAGALLERLRSTLLAAMAHHGWKVGFSVGAAAYLTAPSSIDEMMARADELMYSAKREAKGTVRLAVFPGAGPVPSPR